MYSNTIYFLLIVIVCIIQSILPFVLFENFYHPMLLILLVGIALGAIFSTSLLIFFESKLVNSLLNRRFIKHYSSKRRLSIRIPIALFLYVTIGYGITTYLMRYKYSFDYWVNTN